MKRHESLVPLSHDHHDGLVFCWNVRQGLKRGIDTSRIITYCLWFWQEHLVAHFAEEENWLFVPGHPLCNTAVQQHTQIRTLIETLPQNPENTGALANLIDQHIRLEERQLFPELEKLIPTHTLALIGEKLRQSHAGNTSACYTDEFWKA